MQKTKHIQRRDFLFVTDWLHEFARVDVVGRNGPYMHGLDWLRAEQKRIPGTEVVSREHKGVTEYALQNKPARQRWMQGIARGRERAWER